VTLPLPGQASAYQRAVSSYGDSAVMTASPQRLLVMLYDRLAVDLVRGELAQRQGDREQAANCLGHAQDIIAELLSSLDQSAWDGGPRLAAIYTWLLKELIGAIVTGDAERTAACRACVEPLRDAWAEAATNGASVQPVLTGATA
jgi:flagellar protein FliS